MPPRERAWTVATRLHAEGRSPEQIRGELVRLGFEPDEAAIAAGGLRETGETAAERWARESAQQQHGDQGYVGLLFASLFLASGVLLTVIPPTRTVGVCLLTVGLVLLVRAVRSWWKGRGV